LPWIKGNFDPELQEQVLCVPMTILILYHDQGKMSNDLKYGHKINKLILIADIISGVVLLLFLYTSLRKMTEYEVFKNVLSVSPLLKPFAGTIAWVLPVTELGIVALLFIPSVRLKGLYASFFITSNCKKSAINAPSFTKTKPAFNHTELSISSIFLFTLLF